MNEKILINFFDILIEYVKYIVFDYAKQIIIRQINQRIKGD